MLGVNGKELEIETKTEKKKVRESGGWVVCNRGMRMRYDF